MNVIKPCFKRVKKMALALFLASAIPSAAGASTFHVGYSLADGANVLFGINNFVVGVSYWTVGLSYPDSLGTTVTVTGTQYLAKAGLYSNGLGISSWYLTGGLGKLTLKGKASSNVTSVEGSSSANAMLITAGRHFFLGFLDIKVGLGVINLSGWGDLSIKDTSGTELSAVRASEFPSALPAIDLGIGVNF